MKKQNSKQVSKFDILNIVAIIALVIIVISLIVIFMNLGGRMTGFVVTNTSTATVNVTVSNLVAINFTTNNINFGSGSVTAGQSSATLDSNSSSTAVDGTWTCPGTNFRLVNVGNENVTLNLKTGKTNATLLGGTNPGYRYAVINQKASSCLNPGVTIGAWNEVNTTSTGTLICGNFSSTQASNTIDIYVELVIPSDSVNGSLSDTFTATATGY